MAVSTMTAPRRRAVAVLDADPDLGRHLAPERAAAARAHALAAVELLPVGEWTFDPTDPQIIDCEGALGLLVIEGRIGRMVTLEGVTFLDLIGEGELLRPWDGTVETGADPGPQTWEVHEPTRLAVLDKRFLIRTAHWPELTGAFVERSVRRARSMASQLAICHVNRVDLRLHLLLWHLARRWGRVAAGGLVLPLPLTHRTLASLVCARRPTVTTALKDLNERELVSRREDGSWVLHGEIPEELNKIYAALS
jgi:CRP-like cAMP-binding protein